MKCVDRGGHGDHGSTRLPVAIDGDMARAFLSLLLHSSQHVSVAYGLQHFERFFTSHQPVFGV